MLHVEVTVMSMIGVVEAFDTESILWYLSLNITWVLQ